MPAVSVIHQSMRVRTLKADNLRFMLIDQGFPIYDLEATRNVVSSILAFGFRPGSAHHIAALKEAQAQTATLDIKAPGVAILTMSPTSMPTT